MLKGEFTNGIHLLEAKHVFPLHLFVEVTLKFFFIDRYVLLLDYRHEILEFIHHSI